VVGMVGFEVKEDGVWRKKDCKKIAKRFVKELKGSILRTH